MNKYSCNAMRNSLRYFNSCSSMVETSTLSLSSVEEDVSTMAVTHTSKSDIFRNRSVSSVVVMEGTADGVGVVIGGIIMGAATGTGREILVGGLGVDDASGVRSGASGCMDGICEGILLLLLLLLFLLLFGMVGSIVVSIGVIVGTILGMTLMVGATVVDTVLSSASRRRCRCSVVGYSLLSRPVLL